MWPDDPSLSPSERAAKWAEQRELEDKQDRDIRNLKGNDRPDPGGPVLGHTSTPSITTRRESAELVGAIKVLAGAILGIGVYLYGLVSNGLSLPSGNSLIWNVIGVIGIIIGALLIGGVVGAIAKVGLLSAMLTAVIMIWLVGSRHGQVDTSQLKTILVWTVVAFVVEYIVTKLVVVILDRNKIRR